VISRRRFVIGAGTTAFVGGALAATGALVVRPERVLHRLGLRDSPDHRVPASGRPVVEKRIASAAMGRDVTYAVVVPPTTPIGTVVCLHGRGGNHRMAFDSVRLHDVVADEGVPLAVVGIDGGPTSYWHARDDGTDAMALVLDELMPTLDAELGPLPVAILGWSMGGYGALLLAERAPERFRAVIGISPAIFASYDDATEGAFDGEADFAAHDVYAGRDRLAALDVRIDCGDGDPFVDQARRFADGLPSGNLGRFSRGYHDDAYWRSMAPEQVRTIAAAVTR
jgi:pimeloyl-ACP methyl ester carboxylesterase